MSKQIDSKSIAKDRCKKLLALATKTTTDDPALARRYVKIARAIAMGHRFPLGNRSYCKKCYTVFVPDRTVTVRIDSKNKRVLYKCKHCQAEAAYGYSRQKKKEE
ncbi:hypothetical protein AUJ14_01085 [Candidatus Micrarchaeota archaeon CG1_02_55_22]|nr:MAG: hypothetical protein AUJ14_01085 [Candidatus Micrarchaeota archaeon CG1_02_55_22]